MGVLHVEHGVVHRLPRHDLDVEVDGRVVAPRQQREPCGVGADLVDQLVERDRLARALAHPDRLAASQQRHQLVQHDLEARLDAQRLRHALHPRHPAVVVRAKHVEQSFEPALRLVEEVCAVNADVRRDAVRPHQHAVLLVPEQRGAEEHGAVLFVGKPLAAKSLDRRLHRSRFVKRALAEPRIHANVEPLERAPDPRHGPRDRFFGHAGPPLLRGQVQQRPAVFLGQLRRQVRDVLALVSALGDVGLDPEDPEVAGLERLPEQLDLPPGVVEVVLAPDVVSRGVQDVGERVADRGVAGRPDVQRSDGVGADELHQNRPAVPLRATEPVGVVDDLSDGVVQPRGAQEQIDEPGPSHLGPVDHAVRRDPSGDGSGHLARRAADLRRQHESQVRRPVAVLPGPRPRQLGLRKGGRIQPDLRSSGRGGLRQHPGQHVLDHCSNSRTAGPAGRGSGTMLDRWGFA